MKRGVVRETINPHVLGRWVVGWDGPRHVCTVHALQYLVTACRGLVRQNGDARERKGGEICWVNFVFCPTIYRLSHNNHRLAFFDVPVLRQGYLIVGLAGWLARRILQNEGFQGQGWDRGLGLEMEVCRAGFTIILIGVLVMAEGGARWLAERGAGGL